MLEMQNLWLLGSAFFLGLGPLGFVHQLLKRVVQAGPGFVLGHVQNQLLAGRGPGKTACATSALELYHHDVNPFLLRRPVYQHSPACPPCGTDIHQSQTSHFVSEDGQLGESDFCCNFKKFNQGDPICLQREDKTLISMKCLLSLRTQSVFLAVQNSSIGDIVPWSVRHH